MTEHFTESNFEKEVLKSDKPVLVDFYAEWCVPCKTMSPIIDELAKEFKKKWKIGKVDVDESPGLSEKFGIQHIPTLLIFKDGAITDKLLGFKSKEALKEKLV